MPAVAGIGDTISCGDTLPNGSDDVFVNDNGIVRLGDQTAGHTPIGHGFYPPTAVVNGSGSVFVNNRPVVWDGATISVHKDPPHDNSHPHGGSVTATSSDVFSE